MSYFATVMATLNLIQPFLFFITDVFRVQIFLGLIRGV